MYRAKCPYCGQSNGKDDIVLGKEIVECNHERCKILVKKLCDICNRIYSVEMNYDFDYEELSFD